jgi:hypothetical protein
MNFVLEKSLLGTFGHPISHCAFLEARKMTPEKHSWAAKNPL